MVPQSNMQTNETMIEKDHVFVKKLFDEYEKEGFVETFWTPYTDHQDKIGQKFEVIRRVNDSEADLECLPLWQIKFENGKIITAYPEEIVPSVISEVKAQITV